MFRGKSAEAAHVEALNKKCSFGCGLNAVATFYSYAPVDELMKNSGEYLQAIAAMNGGQVPVLEFTLASGDKEKHVRIGEAYACSVCMPEAEKQAAKAPSWVRCVKDSGPGADVPIVQVTK